METKIILKLDQKLIEKAEHYASEKKLSLSKLIESYLRALTGDKEAPSEIEISPFVKSLSTGVSLPPEEDYKNERKSFLAQKYK